MKNNAQFSRSPSFRRPFQRSLLAACVIALSSPAFAQEASTDANAEVEEVLVTGMRQSLQSAQELKRNAGTVIESITAKDLGSFPDKSIAEALQRVPGITVNRFAASSDTTHFSAEPSGVLVRGLNHVRTEFNGRDSFSANSSRGLSWGDISPELMAGVDTYKNQMAELIEGGIAGSVNMRTRVPFDQDGRMVAFTTSVNYGDLSEKATPELSALYSDRWETDNGDFGFLANIAYSEVKTRSVGNQVGRMNRFRNVYQDDGAELKFIPADFSYLDNLYERERLGGSLAFQWRSADDSLLATVQYNRSEYQNSWRERGLQVTGADHSYGQSVYYEHANASPFPHPDGVFVFTPDGLFQQGQLNFVPEWVGSPGELDVHAQGLNAAGQPFINPNGCYDWNVGQDWAPDCLNAVGRSGGKLGTFGRTNDNENMTQDIGFKLDWAPTETIRGSFDLQYVDSTVENYDINTAYTTFALATADISQGRPIVSFEESPNIGYTEGFLAQPNNYFIDHIMDHLEDSEGNQFSARADFEFDLDVDWATSVKVGVRHANRDQTVRWSNYNWNGVAPTWTSWAGRAAWANLDRHGPDTQFGTGFKGYPDGHYTVGKFDSDFHQLSHDQFVFPNLSLLADRELMASTMSAQALGMPNGVGWNPICSGLGDRAQEIDGTCYEPAEIADVNEKTNAIYVQLNFGGENAEIFGIPYSGNIGVRYVETDLLSKGGLAFPDPYTADEMACTTLDRPDGAPVDAPYVSQSLGCFLTADDIAFANGGSFLNDADVKHDNWLPSFNVKFEPTDDLVIRYAWSTAMARPDIGSLRNYVAVSKTTPKTDNFYDPLWVKDDAGQIVGAEVYYSGNAHNAYLKPIEAKQHDLSFEYYWSEVGSASLAFFTKDFDNYIQSASRYLTYTNEGVTRTAEISGPVNGDGAKLRGAEIAFQTFFDFLPAPYDGFGVQANYTYIDNDGITNSNINNNQPGGGDNTDGQAPDSIGVSELEGLSKDSYNIIGMYEKGDIAVRVAYSWRSEYMVTARDCCVVYPVWSDDQGHLDASIRYNFNDNIEISLQGSNLLNTQTKLRQQVTDSDEGGRLMPNSWFENDRRYTLTLRFKY